MKNGPKWLKLKHYFLTKQILLKKEHPLLSPEILVDALKLTGVGIEQLKSIDNWALIMTIFVILNPDQEHPFFLDFQNDREKGVSDSASNLLKKYF